MENISTTTGVRFETQRRPHPNQVYYQVCTLNTVGENERVLLTAVGHSRLAQSASIPSPQKCENLVNNNKWALYTFNHSWLIAKHSLLYFCHPYKLIRRYKYSYKPINGLSPRNKINVNVSYCSGECNR